MPTPHHGESESVYVHRAVPEVLRDGTAKNPTQAVAIAFGMFRQHRRKLKRRKSLDWHVRKRVFDTEPAASWNQTKNMGAAVSPALSSVDATIGGVFRPSCQFGAAPFHRRKLKKKTTPPAVELKRNELALAPAAEEKSIESLDLVETRAKPLGLGWSYKYAAGSLQGYGLDFTFPGQPQYDEAALSITFPFAASHGRDRVGDFLHVGGIDTTNHRKNPVAFLDHGKSHPLPIGKCESPEGDYTVTLDENRGLALATVFLDRDESTHNGKVARQVFSLFEQGILRAGSIGYRPLGRPKVLPPVPEKGFPQGLDLERTELLEVTLCGLPCNQDAVRRALDEGWSGKSWEPEVRMLLESHLLAEPPV